nr:hypothetical protein BaRGS_020949 [Batillaria attramentaria]
MTKELLTEPQGNQAPHIQQLMGRAGFFRDGSTENYTEEDDGTSKYSFKDVFVLLRRDTDPADTDGQHNDIGVVRGLRSSGIPVRVVGRDDEDGVAEMVTIQEKDEGEVTVATILHARGLERKIVVWVGVGEGDYYDVYDKYHATSRAMEKVVWVKAPYEIDFDDAVRNDSDDDEDA